MPHAIGYRTSAWKDMRAAVQADPGLREAIVEIERVADEERACCLNHLEIRRTQIYLALRKFLATKDAP
jgi:hypothetical protein